MLEGYHFRPCSIKKYMQVSALSSFHLLICYGYRCNTYECSFLREKDSSLVQSKVISSSQVFSTSGEPAATWTRQHVRYNLSENNPLDTHSLIFFISLLMIRYILQTLWCPTTKLESKFSMWALKCLYLYRHISMQLDVDRRPLLERRGKLKNSTGAVKQLVSYPNKRADPRHESFQQLTQSFLHFCTRRSRIEICFISR